MYIQIYSVRLMMSDIREVLGSGYPDSKFTTRFSLEHEMTSDAFQALLKLRKLALHFHTTIFGKFFTVFMHNLKNLAI